MTHPTDIRAAGREEKWEADFDEEFRLKEFGIKCGSHSPCKGFDCIKSFIRRVRQEAQREMLEACQVEGCACAIHYAIRGT